MRESDSVSRHGGDEFVVLLAELARPSDAAAVAQKIIETLQAPALVGPHRVAVSASLGISVYPEDGDDPSTLIECADAAMYRAKRAGPGGYAFCSEIAEGTHREARSLGDVAPHRRADSSALAEHEANKQLVSAAQTAQRLQSNAEEAHHRQINFVAMAAHALRNPLSAIRVAAMTMQHPRADDAMRAGQHEIVQRQSAHMARLIDDLLDGSRVGAREFRLKCSHLELSGILRDAIAACRHAIDKKRQRLLVEFDPALAIVHADPQRLTQVFTNLLNNASRRSHPGGDILLAAKCGADQVIVTVADHGVGIAAEELPHIFDLFAIDSSVPVDESGLGIGLAVVHELVKAHGGTVAASSAGKDLGSEFIVRLPLAAAAA